MSTIQVEIVSAEGEIFSGTASMVYLPGREGDIGVAPRHTPLLTMLRPGEVRVQDEQGGEQSFYVGGGALEIQPNKVSVLADTAMRAKDLDEAQAMAAKQRAEEALAGKHDNLTQAEALAELTRVAAQLKMIEKLRKIKG